MFCDFCGSLQENVRTFLLNEIAEEPNQSGVWR